jgi:nucleotidyltransferase/DNA polymerase involved in DNA repair
MPKSLSVERTFREDVDDFARVRKEAAEATSELFRRLTSANLAYKVGGIKIRFRGFETHTREKTLPTHSESEELLQQTVSSLLDEFEREDKPVRLVGIRVADLKPTTTEASSLDAWSGK